MSSRYERVNAHDDEEPDTPVQPAPRLVQPIPNSPPPSFHSRASSVASRERQGRVDSTLADAFDTEGDDSEDEADDRQRLVRGGDSTPTINNAVQFGDNTNPAQPRTTPQTNSGAQVPSPATGSRRIYGGGIQSDGVFSNLTAKPERTENEKEEQPPTYEQAAADAAPPYWETTILAPGLGGPDEVYIDGMPVGSFFSFVWNGMISMSFQLVGFLLTYLLHSTHAAKNGSRAGLGITLIQYGFYMKGTSGAGAGGMGGQGGMAGQDGQEGYANPTDPNAHDFDPNTVTGGGGDGGGSGGGLSDIASSDWVAYILMIVGWFILIRAVSDYLRARSHERLVLQSPDRGLGVAVIAEGENPERVV
ncbi:Metal homeostatis protein BSD2 [Pleurostoma richardsiae]|uniref:Metal homeostatis protein BSD2 n=1 Tax=Pleurostoma richardsiae TaxID=41990 RepID=A0AA38VTD1_9PEZI|nr:Metal homeostatis protein BSD2 [Pleurostoma richardsiae]